MKSSTDLLLSLVAIDHKGLKPFVVYGVGYAVMGLMIPLAVQLMVSNLALTGLGLSLFSLSVAILLGLIFYQLFRFCQILILEFLERRVIHHWIPRLQNVPDVNKIYYFELAIIPKVLSKWALDGFEIFLTLLVSSLVLVVYHPYYLVILIAVWISLWAVYRLGHEGLETALAECSAKYDTWYDLLENKEANSDKWLLKRARHFTILQRQIVLLMFVQIIGTLSLLVGGAWLFSNGQLSIGQFVATELIGGGIFIAVGKLAKFMETHYSLLTSLAKLESSQEAANE